MVVNQPGRLHEGVADRGADEAETDSPQGRRERVRLPRAGRYRPRAAPAVAPGFAADEGPHEPVETAVFTLHCKKCPRVAHGALDLQAVADDPRIAHQS